MQFMGKDNVPFHTVIFPATLLGTGQPWTMMRSISVTEYLNYEGTQFSKSRGTGALRSLRIINSHEGTLTVDHHLDCGGVLNVCCSYAQGSSETIS